MAVRRQRQLRIGELGERMAAGDKLSRAGMKASGVRRVVAMERVLAVARVDAKIKATAVHHEYG